MKKIKPKHITNIKYQDFQDIFYYISYPNIRPYFYGINIYGEIISLDKNREKIRKQDMDKRGYARIILINKDGVRKHVLISRLVAWEFVGHPENYNELEVNHVDGVHLNNYYKNLEWVTHNENNIHKTIYNLAASSEKHGWNKHKEKVVIDVIKMIDEGVSAPNIASIIIQKYPKLYNKTKKDYNRLRGLVSKINNGNSWYKLKKEMEGSTTIESIIYEKHIGEEVSRVGLHPMPVRNGGQIIFGKRK